MADRKFPSFILDKLLHHKLVRNFSPGVIDIWYADVNRLLPYLDLFESLTRHDELNRSRQFKFQYDRQRYVLQHGLMRFQLSELLNCNPLDLDICTEPNGKPYLAGQSSENEIHFNISGSSSFVANAFSRIGRMGIDIEKIREIPEMMEIAERHFTQNEQKFIISRPSSERLKLFCKIWTRKEAVLKAQGKGLLMPLDGFDVQSGNNSRQPFRVQISEGVSKEDIWIMDLQAPAGYVAAVASKNPFQYVIVREFGLNSI